MNKKKKEIIDILTKIIICNDLEDFYILCTKLYYKINELVFRLECDFNVCDNRTNFD